MSLRKRVRIGKYAVPVLLLLTIAIGTVAAAAYVVLTWTISLTVASHPRVAFWDGGSVQNSLTLSMNIFPEIRTIDEDLTGWDIRSNATGDVYIRVPTLDTNDIDELVITAYNATDNLFDLTYTDVDNDWTGPFTTPTAAEDYDLRIEVLAADTATDPAQIIIEMKVESP